ncbi:hypothetical protein MMC07_005499 [Pseudocyphellaria aurata]|nr:hypothetical protein [Pseudocyphellaria aurata]
MMAKHCEVDGTGTFDMPFFTHQGNFCSRRKPKVISFTDVAIAKETANTITAFILMKEVTVTQETGDTQAAAALTNPEASA